MVGTGMQDRETALGGGDVGQTPKASGVPDVTTVHTDAVAMGSDDDKKKPTMMMLRRRRY